ncbi:hypothetical protein HPB48_005321 [Haemaphysalis longicornis]|uniref:Uncharacterized protein n=1 Tax=Haemaphysalis longicornis TaxID=44386 RepID=A0A9J6GI71_HAELO|nr:hypothetical protein HPB48_005321 [Haemaphysalis longicornis]
MRQDLRRLLQPCARTLVGRCRGGTATTLLREPVEVFRVRRAFQGRRLASVQLVVGVTEHVSKCYCEVKARSAFLSAALTNAENAVVAVVKRCQREAWARIDRRKLEFVDSLACRGLEELERRYPAALRRPEEIVADVAAFAHKKAEQAKGFARGKVVCALAVLPAALHIAPAEALASGFHQVVLSGKRVVLVADGYLDDLVAAYNALHTLFPQQRNCPCHSE